MLLLLSSRSDSSLWYQASESGTWADLWWSYLLLLTRTRSDKIEREKNEDEKWPKQLQMLLESGITSLDSPSRPRGGILGSGEKRRVRGGTGSDREGPIGSCQFEQTPPSVLLIFPAKRKLPHIIRFQCIGRHASLKPDGNSWVISSAPLQFI